jgi:hypothetical protein
MPEAPGLYLRLSVSENLEYFAGLYGLHHPAQRIACRGQSCRPGRGSLRWALTGAASACRACANLAERPEDHVPRRTDIGSRSSGGA